MLPTIQSRLAGFHTDLGRLIAWSAQLPAGALWKHRLNEMRLVRATLAWEDFLQESLCCYLRGSTSVSGRSYALANPAATSLLAAETMAIGTLPFGKWLNENWMLQRSSVLFAGTNPYALLASPTFREIRIIRNRIVHRSDVSRVEFRAVATALHGSVRPGLTPGQLLSDDIGGQPRIEVYLQSLHAAAQLIGM